MKEHELSEYELERRCDQESLDILRRCGKVSIHLVEDGGTVIHYRAVLELPSKQKFAHRNFEPRDALNGLRRKLSLALFNATRVVPLQDEIKKAFQQSYQ